MFFLLSFIFALLSVTAAFSPSGVQVVHFGPTSTVLFDKKSGKKKVSATSSKGFGSALRDLQKNSFQYAGAIRPGKQSPQKVVVDASIIKPDYADDGIVS